MELKPYQTRVFQTNRTPEPLTPIGYAAFIDVLDLNVPLPTSLVGVVAGDRRQSGRWVLLPERYLPQPTLGGHLTFALKHEGVDLAVLKQIFLTSGPAPIVEWVKASPTSKYARRSWFFYEWLTGESLPLEDVRSGNYCHALDPKVQYAIMGNRSRRHRVWDNLPGTAAFCPLIRRTDTLDAAIGAHLSERAAALAAKLPRHLAARTAAFLLVADSRSSFAIEQERPAHSRVQRWGQVIGQAGRYPIDKSELLRLQRIVIGDARFVRLGLREQGGFVGRHDRETMGPLPEHVSAHPRDLESLLNGTVALIERCRGELDPVLTAAAVAFGFVYIHPFVDGNGRVHRYLVHHVLAESRFSPPTMPFPISSAFLSRVDEYRDVLESYSSRLLPAVKWRPTPDGNVEVLADTADFYRYFDATRHAEFLYACVEDTLEQIPREALFLQQYDRFAAAAQEVIDLPEQTVDKMFRSLQGHNGRFSARARQKAFASLTPEEVERLEAAYAAAFELDDDQS